MMKKSLPIDIDKLPKGVDMLHNPILNKGTAYTMSERQVLGLKGLLPPHILTQEEQKIRVLSTFRGNACFPPGGRGTSAAGCRSSAAVPAAPPQAYGLLCSQAALCPPVGLPSRALL